MTELSREDIEHLSRLARLELTAEEYERYASQLTKVVGYVEQLQVVDTRHITETHHTHGPLNVLAKDEVRGEQDPLAVDTNALLAAAPLYEGNLLQVRAVLNDDEAMTV
jgi:aspartyl-tRNA(Asn)/glutamyl-tRNA(Gln) amidotransferase subunit C